MSSIKTLTYNQSIESILKNTRGTFSKDCHALIGFELSHGNIYHWAKKIMILFFYLNLYVNPKCTSFSTIQFKVFNDKEPPLFDWHKDFLTFSTGLTEKNINYLKSNDNKLQCFEKLFVAGNSNYLVVGPKESIFLRKMISKKMNLKFERKRVLFLKRKKSRFILNENNLKII